MIFDRSPLLKTLLMVMFVKVSMALACLFGMHLRKLQLRHLAASHLSREEA
jgi:hypothetical protein